MTKYIYKGKRHSVTRTGSDFIVLEDPDTLDWIHVDLLDPDLETILESDMEPKVTPVETMSIDEKIQNVLDSLTTYSIEHELQNDEKFMSIISQMESIKEDYQ